jgi:lysosomal acid lipase/cholesteryl ester hydrolase
MDKEQITRKHGYPIEVHEITTKDGYILETFRIPYGKKPKQSAGPQEAILINHAFVSSGIDYFAVAPDALRIQKILLLLNCY